MEDPDHNTAGLLGQITNACIRSQAVAGSFQVGLSKVAPNAGKRIPAPHEGVLGGTVLPVNPAAASKGAAALNLPPPADPEKNPTSPIKPWRGVFFDGPQSDENQEGDEIPIWVVYVGGEEAEPIGKVYRCLAFAPAEALAKRMAKDRKLELVHEAMPA
jgi:hypothetical protein